MSKQNVKQCVLLVSAGASQRLLPLPPTGPKTRCELKWNLNYLWVWVPVALKPTGNWWQVEPRLHLMTARIGSTNLATLTARWLNGWMNVKIAPPSGWTPDLLYWIVKRYFKLEGILDVLRLSNNRATCLLSLLSSSPTCTWCLGRGTAACSANVCVFGVNPCDDAKLLHKMMDHRGWRQVGYRNKCIGADQHLKDVTLKEESAKLLLWWLNWHGTSAQTVYNPLLPTLIIILS